MYDLSAIMKVARVQYRQMGRRRTGLDRKLFADVLRFTRIRQSAASSMPPKPSPPLSDLEQRIDALKYLSFRYDIGRMAQEMRAEAARTTGAAR